MRRLVVDASIAVKWLNPQETLADKANLIRDDYAQGQVSLLILLKKSFPKNDENIFRSQMLYNRFSDHG